MLWSVFLFVGLILPAAAATPAGCPAIPTDVPWWKNTSAGSVQKYVDDKFTGEWGTYISKWERQFVKLQKIYEKGSAVVVTKDRIKLQGDSLQDYIEKVGRRIDAIRCFAGLDEKMMDEEARALAALDTAAGSNSEDGATTVELAQVAGIAAKLEIVGICELNEAIFQVTNVGGEWPEMGKFVVYRTDDDSMLSELRLRLAEEQTFAFKVNASPGESFGLWVKPSWDARKFRYDAEVVCD